MTFELIVFVLLFFILLFSSTIISNSKGFTFFFILLSIVYILTVRLSGFHDDFINYIKILKYPIITLFQFYYLKECFYWLLSNLIYSWLNSELYTYLIYDFFCLYLLVKIKNNFNLPSYFILFFFLIFPSLMGFQNVYRQFVSTVIVLYSISLAFQHKKSKFFFYFIALLTHNVTIFVFPLLFIFDKNKKSKYAFFFSFLMVFILLYFESKTKSFSSHGLSLGFVYIILIFALSYFIISKNKLTKTLIHKKISFYSSYLFFLLLILFFILGESQLERTGMLSIQLLLPFICLYIDKFYKEKILFRFILIIILVVPTFVFKNALSMLLN